MTDFNQYSKLMKLYFIFDKLISKIDFLVMNAVPLAQNISTESSYCPLSISIVLKTLPLENGYINISKYPPDAQA